MNPRQHELVFATARPPAWWRPRQGEVARGPNGGRRARDKRNHAFGCGWEATDPQGAGLLRLTGSRVVGHGDPVRLSSASRPGGPRRRPSSAPLVGASCTSDADEQGWGPVIVQRTDRKANHHRFASRDQTKNQGRMGTAIRARPAPVGQSRPPLSGHNGGGLSARLHITSRTSGDAPLARRMARRVARRVMGLSGCVLAPVAHPDIGQLRVLVAVWLAGNRLGIAESEIPACPAHRSASSRPRQTAVRPPVAEPAAPEAAPAAAAWAAAPRCCARLPWLAERWTAAAAWVQPCAARTAVAAQYWDRRGGSATAVPADRAGGCSYPPPRSSRPPNGGRSRRWNVPQSTARAG